MERGVRSLSAKDICSIIKAGSEAQLLRLKFEGLELEFRGAIGGKEGSLLVVSSETGSVDSEQLAKDTLEQEVRQHKEDKLAELALTDPVEFEKLMSSGEFEHARTETR